MLNNSGSLKHLTQNSIRVKQSTQFRDATNLLLCTFFTLWDEYNIQRQSWDPGPVLFTPVPGFKHRMTGIPPGNYLKINASASRRAVSLWTAWLMKPTLRCSTKPTAHKKTPNNRKHHLKAGFVQSRGWNGFLVSNRCPLGGKKGWKVENRTRFQIISAAMRFTLQKIQVFLQLWKCTK